MDEMNTLKRKRSVILKYLNIFNLTHSVKKSPGVNWTHPPHTSKIS